MIRIVIFCCLCLSFISCKQDKNSSAKENIETDAASTKESFFPVTNYLKGQVYEVQKNGVNPIKYVTTGSRTDSSWIKMEDFTREVAPFLDVLIDTQNLVQLFEEKKFLDQTIDAYTFSYDPVKQLPDTFTLRHWDVYVDPSTNKVRRIYLVRVSENKTQQLTWQSGKWCKMVTISNGTNGKAYVEKDILIKWDF